MQIKLGTALRQIKVMILIGPRENFFADALGGLNSKFKICSRKVFKLSGVLSKLIQLKHIKDGGVEAKSPAAEQFL